MFEIYVVCLASYNSGKEYGEWMNVTSDYEKTLKLVKEMLGRSPEPGAEEWAIHDCDLKGLLEECEDSLYNLCEFAEILVESKRDPDLIIETMKTLGFSVSEAVEYLDENYVGHYSSVEEYAGEFLGDVGVFNGFPDELIGYFDFEAYARDLEINGLITIKDGDGVHIMFNGQ